MGPHDQDCHSPSHGDGAPHLPLRAEVEGPAAPQGYTVDDHWLTTREETEAFKAEHNVKTTPQTFIDGKRIGGYDDLRRYFGKRCRTPRPSPTGR